jgi:glycosyltransferase involved in cell wall biosynthesis
MNNTPLVSILVPIYNRLEFLGRTLQSLRGQSYTNIEVLCVDDGSTQRPDQIIENLHDDRFKLFRHEKNLGLPSARNTALKNSRGDFICLLDSDDIYLPFTIEMRLYFMKRLGDVDAVYTRALKNIMDFVTFPDGHAEFQTKQRELYWDCEFNRDLILVQNLCPCTNWMITRKAWDKSGNYLFDSELTTSEDWDFTTAISRKTDYHNLGFIDTENTFVRNKKDQQMTGNRNFAEAWPRIYKRWRDTAIDKNFVITSQNNILRQAGLNPLDFDL